ncbi:MAG: hypothetical protein KIH62_002835 [Candidatus Kerfeldbacteria bacterium]|nr:hypothetical protein [Candidatus Kerfeldbacteria bacterium]
MNTRVWAAFGGTFLCAFAVLTPTTRATESASIYGALYEGGNLVSTNGESMNGESVITYHPDHAGFIAITTNDAGAEWWTSNATGTVWEQSTTNPLDGYGCTGVSRHAIATYKDEVYFGANCEEDSVAIARIFKLTSKDTVELLYSRTAGNEDFFSYYPASGVVNDTLYMFYNGGFTQYDGTTFTDVEDATGQTAGTPLEVTRAIDGVAYLPQVDGSVQTFDGSTYTTIGEDYLEDAIDSSNHNLPSAAIFNGTVYVGNQDFDNGATLFAYDPTDADTDSELWEVAATFDAEDTIINKMQVSQRVDGDRYLVIYTANAATGSNIYVMDTTGDVQKLVDSGLGETSPEYNVEVISAVRRTVTYGIVEKDIMLFATKNLTDQTKVFVLNLDTRLAFDALPARIISAVEDAGVGGSSRMRAQSMDSTPTATTAVGEEFVYKIKKKRVQTGALYSLWIDGVQVDEVVGYKGYPVTLSDANVANLESGDTFEMQVGVQPVYGRKAGKVLATNVIMGDPLTVTVQ